MNLFGGHLGDPRLAALVDGELSHDDRDRALAHIAACPACRRLVEGEKVLKDQMMSMAMPEPSARLWSSLLQVGREDQEPEDSAISAGVDRLAEAAVPLLDVEGRLRQIMGDAYRRPPQISPVSDDDMVAPVDPEGLRASATEAEE